MNDSSEHLSGDPPPAAPDWHSVADKRLAKLVELEQECAITRGQLSALQADRHQWEMRHAEELRASHAQRHALLVELEQLEVEMASIEDALQAAQRECASLSLQLQAMRDEFLNSSSWRVTAPLRALSQLLGRSKRR